MKELREQYAEILRSHLARPGEEQLYKGYNFGRSCANQGLAMSEMVAMHFEILESEGLLTDESLPDSQALLLEVSLAMSLSGGMKTMEHVLAALYDETIRQFKELRQAKEQLKDYSLNLEKKVREKLQQLQNAEERFTILVETIPDIVYKIDMEGRFVYLNPAVSALGYEPRELIGKHFHEVILPDDLGLVSGALVLPGYAGRTTGDKEAPKLFDERRTGTRRTSGLEVRLLLKSGKVVHGVLDSVDGRVLVGEVNSSGLHELHPETRQRKLIGTVGVIRDITERKRTEVELLKYHSHLEELVAARTAELSATNQALQTEIVERQGSEAFVRNILEGMEEGLVVLDREYRIVIANRAYAELAGASVAGIIGRHCYEVTHQLDQPCHLANGKHPCAVHDTEADGKPHTVFHEHVDEKGRRRLVEVKSCPLLDSEGKGGTVIEIIKDISEQKRMEEQLRQAQKMEAIGTLAGGIAHDFNNILTAILGFAELTMMELPSAGKAHEDLAEVIKASNRAKELIRQILSFSRHSDQEFKPLLIQSVLNEALKLLRSSIPTTIDIKQDIDPSCGPVMADPTQIHQIIMNLCTNAYHAMRETGGILAVSLSHTELGRGDLIDNMGLEPGRYVILEVNDTGCGIPPENLEKIFDPYFTTKKMGEGNGLGLSVVHGIVKSHGGHVNVYSEPGQGSTFQVYLPIQETGNSGGEGSKAENALLMGPERNMAESTLPRGTERILVVDDDANIVQIIQRILDKLGYRVTPFTSGEEALQGFLQQPEGFDLVISDITMPAMTGIELAKKIFASRPKTPVILCTGFSDLIDKEKALAMGIKDFAMKPVSRRELALLVRKTMDENSLPAKQY